MRNMEDVIEETPSDRVVKAKYLMEPLFIDKSF